MSTPARTTTVQELASHLNASGIRATLLGDGTAAITTVEVFERAGAGCLTFVRSAPFAKRWRDSAGSAALISADVAALAHPEGAAPQPGRALIVVPDADLALVLMLNFFAPPAPKVAPGVHPTAIVDPSAEIAASATVGPYCTIGAGARIGERARLDSHVHVGAGVTIGSDTLMQSGAAVLDRCIIGSHCVLAPSSVVGRDGFGFRPAHDGRGLVKIPHIGNVVLEDHVEIGANSCVDRGKFSATLVRTGTKIDNLVQIAHNCVIGRCCIICGGCLLAGSVTLEDGVIMGGGVSVAEGCTVGAGAKVGALSGVSHSLAAGGEYMGFPISTAAEFRRSAAVFRKMGKRTVGKGSPSSG